MNSTCLLCTTDSSRDTVQYFTTIRSTRPRETNIDWTLRSKHTQPSIGRQLNVQENGPDCFVRSSHNVTPPRTVHTIGIPTWFHPSIRLKIKSIIYNHMNVCWRPFNKHISLSDLCGNDMTLCRPICKTYPRNLGHIKDAVKYRCNTLCGNLYDW